MCIRDSIKEGPVAEGAAAADAAAVAVVAADAEGDVVVAEAVAAAGDSKMCIRDRARARRAGAVRLLVACTEREWR